MTSEVLPPRQKEVLGLIVRLTEDKGYPPTLAELAKALGLRNRMTVHQHVVALKKKGMVHWEPGLNRSLRVVDGDTYNQLLDEVPSEEIAVPDTAPLSFPRRQSSGIPLAGTIAAGAPIDATGGDEYLDVDKQFAGSGCFALKIKGDSMIEDGIYDGDYVIVKPQPSPRNGEIVVALLEDGTATLKRFFKEKDRFRLQPANANMEPIYVESTNQLQVQGVVVGLFRRMS